ncbi:MAG TPA: hypothetical protein VGV37_03880 [Aliidongia sp.]|nr:hypothetical protein [Aliidongia sp.]HEV2673655.1 hypothetical protein [Aliidongia sp.]
MISKPSGAAECFVYMTLPGETAPVTAGRFAGAFAYPGFRT